MEAEEIHELIRRIENLSYIYSHTRYPRSRKQMKRAENKLLNNQESLRGFVEKAYNYGVLYGNYYTTVEHAIEYVTDEDVLNELALKAKWGRHRRAAIRNPNLRDEKTLAQIALRKASNFFTEIDGNHKESFSNIYLAIGKISDDELLEMIARHGDERVRPDALKRITSEEILTDFALNSNSSRLRAIAASKITNQKVICNILRKPEECDVSMAAISRAENQEYLKSLALNEKYARDRKSRHFCAAAIDAIVDEDILIHIAQTTKYPLLRKAAIRNPHLKDEDVLIDFLRYDESAEVRLEAAKKITNQNALIDAALNETSYKVIEVASDKINSKNALRKIIANGYVPIYASLRLKEINRLSNKRQLKLLKGQ